jgi:hypothetical protein
MPTARINNPFLPATKQVAAGAGTVLSVFATVPDGFRHRSDGVVGGPSPLACTLYDGPPTSGGVAIHSMTGSNSGDATQAPLNLTFSNGLYVSQTKGGEINVAYTS